MNIRLRRIIEHQPGGVCSALAARSRRRIDTQPSANVEIFVSMTKTQRRRHINDSSNKFGSFQSGHAFPAAQELISEKLVTRSQRSDDLIHGKNSSRLPAL